MTDKSVITVETCCPRCQHHFNRAEVIGEEKAMPEPGDCSVCIECAAILVYTDARGNVRSATAKDIADLMRNREQWATLEKAQFVIRQMNERRAEAQ